MSFRLGLWDAARGHAPWFCPERQDKSIHTRSPGPRDGLGRFPNGGPCGSHVVNYQHPGVSYPRGSRNAKRTSQVLDSLRPREPHLRLSVLDFSQGSAVKWYARRSGELFSEDYRLIESPPDQSLSMNGDRDDHAELPRLEIPAESLDQNLRESPGRVQRTIVLKPDQCSSHFPLVKDAVTGSTIARRIRQAPAAQLRRTAAQTCHRQPALETSRWGYEFDGFPASRAQG